MWLARDKNKHLMLYINKPDRKLDMFISFNKALSIDRNLFSEVTWENSPVEVELKIKK